MKQRNHRGRPRVPGQPPRSVTIPGEAVPHQGPGEIVAPETAEWPIPPLAQRLHRTEGDHLTETTALPSPHVVQPLLPPHYHPGPAEVRVVLAHLLARLTTEQASLRDFVSRTDLSAHPRAGEALQALSLFETHLKNAWRCVGSALSALEW